MCFGVTAGCSKNGSQRDYTDSIGNARPQPKAGEKVMSKGQKSNKETKKLPAMTAKEKRAAKKGKKNEKGRIGE